MAILIISEHDNAVIKSAVLNTVAAGRKLGEDVHVLVAGFECNTAAEAAANIEVSRKCWWLMLNVISMVWLKK